MTTARIRELLDRGAPWEACDAFRELVAAAPSADPEVLYWGALAHARAGATHEAHTLLDEAQPRAKAAGATALLAEILSLRGRLWKDAVHRAPGSPDAPSWIARARDQYLAAYSLAGAPYPGINAATLSWLLDDRDAARRLAGEVAARLAHAANGFTQSATGGAAPAPGAWDLATLGEARLLLGDVAGAGASYAAAQAASARNAGMIASMRRQLALLVPGLPAAREVLDGVIAPSVVAFVGHMVDLPGRPRPRFPRALVPAVRAALRDRLAAMCDPIVYTSAACGSDLLLIETALDRNAEVNVVLPFGRDDFVRSSVAVGGDDWLPRFEAALARAHRVDVATGEPYLGDDVLFDQAARRVEGLAVLRAGQLQTTPSLLCVADLASEDRQERVGGTLATLASWRAHGRSADVIDLGTLRTASAPPDEPGARRVPVAPNVSSPASVPCESAVAPRDTRELRCMLFADFAGYSRLDDAILPRFQRQFLDVASSLIGSAASPPLEAKTWGDALYAVFERASYGAWFALEFAERVRVASWATAESGAVRGVRIALHSGAVFRAFDPVSGRDGHFGADVTRAARIEPITPPGLVYASEAFAAALAAEGADAFALEYIGTLQLAKGYGESRVYRLERR